MQDFLSDPTILNEDFLANFSAAILEMAFVLQYHWSIEASSSF